MLKPGDQVRVTGGPFTGGEGQIVGLDDAGMTVAIRVFGRTVVIQVPPSELEPISLRERYQHTRALAMANHEYSVEFRIWGDALDATQVTRDLGLEPCQTRTAGGSRFPGRIDTGMWAYNGPPGARTEWESLEEGLTFVLEHFWPHRQTIAKYAATSEPVWWCGHFQSSFDGGPTLSAALLKKLGDFGVPLYIDNYFSPPEPAPSKQG